MTTSFVGLENLPNVYFRDITISSINDVQGEQKFSRVSIKLVVKDTKIDNKFQWSDDELLGSYLNIKILQSLDKDFTNQLTDGRYTLHQFDYQTSPKYDRNLVSTAIKVLRPNDNPELHAVGNNEYDFEYEFSFDIQDNALIDVAYFACITVNLNMMMTDFAANFAQSEIKYFQGPISSEKVFVDAQLQTKTNVFYLPNNTIWSGPVHEQNNQIMAGAFHKPAPHAVLTKVETENLKLKDSRNTNNQSKEVNTFMGERLFIGNPYNTKDENGTIKKLIYFDMKNMFIEKTVYGELLNQLSPELFEEALNTFTIKKLTIKRKFVKLKKVANSFKNKKRGYTVLNDRTKIVLFASDASPYNLVPNGPITTNKQWFETPPLSVIMNSWIQEINMGDRRYIYFNFTDRGFKDLKYGNYIYSLELLMLDRTKDFLSSLYVIYKNNVKDLESYYLRARKPKNLSLTTQQFKKSFVKSENQLYGLDNIDNLNIVPWLKGVENYISLKSYLYNMEKDEQTSQGQQIFNSINPKTGSPRGISLFIEKYQNLLNEFIRKFNLEQTKVGTFNNRNSPANASQTHPSLTLITHNYEEIYNATYIREGYRVFEPIGPELTPELNGFAPGAGNGPSVQNTDPNQNNGFATGAGNGPSVQNNGVPIMSRDTFDQRRQQEIDRFFRAKPNFNQDETKNLTREQISDLSNIESFSSAFMSPVTLISKSRSIDLSQTNLVNDTLLNNTIQEITNRERTGTNAFSNTITMQKLRTLTATNDEDPKFENITNYLGNSTPLSNIDFGYTLEDLKDIERIQVEKKIKDAVAKRRKTKMINSFDLTKQNNVISTKIRNKKIRRHELRKIPLHTKAIISSRSQSVRTNILNSPTDLLASNETDNKLLIQHFAVQKVQYFDGFKMDKKGQPIFNMPKWKLLDLEAFQTKQKENLICRIVYYDDETIGLRLPKELELEIFDSYFIIKAAEKVPQTNRKFISNIAISYNSNEQVNYDYATTNPLKQPTKENSIFTEPPEPNKSASDLNTSTRNGTLTSRQRRRARNSNRQGRY